MIIFHKPGIVRPWLGMISLMNLPRFMWFPEQTGSLFSGAPVPMDTRETMGRLEEDGSMGYIRPMGFLIMSTLSHF